MVKRSLNWVRKHKIITLLVIIGVIVFGIAAYYKISLELNKRAFQQASVAIDTIYADIVKELGPPDDSKSSKRCRGFQGPYGEGPLSCYIDVSFIYPVNDKQEANEIQNEIQSLVNNKISLLALSQVPTDPYITGTAGLGNAPVKYYYESNSGLKCVFSYYFDPVFDPSLELDNPKNKIFYIGISCSGPSKGKYF